MRIDCVKLDRQRFIKGLSICQLSSVSGVSKATLSRALKGNVALRPQTVLKIATALDMAVEDFLLCEEV